jgi:3-hydroxybutyryl-CoA dehydrogenase
LGSSPSVHPDDNEAFLMLGESVASAKGIDDGMKHGAGHPLGPLAMVDMIGLYVCLAMMDVL